MFDLPLHILHTVYNYASISVWLYSSAHRANVNMLMFLIFIILVR